jgi:hypothetical protein
MGNVQHNCDVMYQPLSQTFRESIYKELLKAYKSGCFCTWTYENIAPWHLTCQDNWTKMRFKSVLWNTMISVLEFCLMASIFIQQQTCSYIIIWKSLVLVSTYCPSVVLVVLAHVVTCSNLTYTTDICVYFSLLIMILQVTKTWYVLASIQMIEEKSQSSQQLWEILSKPHQAEDFKNYGNIFHYIKFQTVNLCSKNHYSEKSEHS